MTPIYPVFSDHLPFYFLPFKQNAYLHEQKEEINEQIFFFIII